MSPSESELRAALRDGEGRPLDVDAVVAAAQAAHRQRRLRLGAVAGAVLAVAGIGVGSALAFGGHGGRTPVAGSAATSAPPAYDSPVTGRSPLPRTLPEVASVQCPARAPYTQLPQQSARSPRTVPLFPDSVAAVKLCAYASSGHPLGTSREVGGSAGASQLAESMEHAAVQQPAYKCAPDRDTDAAFLVVIAVGRDDTPMPPVTAHVTRDPCAQWITNGTAVRYAWAPPPDLWQRLLHPAGSGSTPPGRATVSTAPPTLNRGSPPR